MLNQEELEEIQRKLKKIMGKKRYLHTMGVQYTSVMLAMRYGADIQQAALAGLLHDCAKCLDDENMLKECTKHHIDCTPTEKLQPYLLHAKLGAFYAREKYGIADQQILSAICYHTTGRPNMSLLEQIVFVADYIEPHRKMIPQLPEIRQIAFTDLEQAVFKILQSTLEYLNSSENQKMEKRIEEHTIQAYEYYQQKYFNITE